MISRTTVSTVSVQMRICSRMEARSVPVECAQSKAAVREQRDLTPMLSGTRDAFDVSRLLAVLHQCRRHENSRDYHHEDRDEDRRIEKKGSEPNRGAAIARPLVRTPFQQDEHENDRTRDQKTIMRQTDHHSNYRGQWMAARVRGNLNDDRFDA